MLANGASSHDAGTLHVRMRFGEPFTLVAPAGADPHEELESATTEIMVRIGRLLPEDRWGAYAEEIRASGPGGE